MGSAERIHLGAKVILEANGYRFDSDGNLIGYQNYPIRNFPNEDRTNTNPYVYYENTIYLTNFEANQWIGKSVLATTGNAQARATLRAVSGHMGIIGLAANDPMSLYGTRIFIENIPDGFLRLIDGNVRNSFLIYKGVRTFQMANGSSQVFPVFQLFSLFNDTHSQALNAFNETFDEGVYKREDGYEYSRINGRTFGRDIATKKELHEWNGNQWITLIGN